MKRLIVLLTVFILILSGCVREKYMAIEFDETVGQLIDFGAVSGMPAFPIGNAYSMVVFLSIDTEPTTVGTIYSTEQSGGPLDIAPTLFLDSSVGGFERRFLMEDQSFTTGGIWRTATDTFVADGRLYSFGISYNRTNVANDPSFYINGVSEAIDTEIQPTGVAIAGLAGTFRIGPTAALPSIIGKELLLLFYDRFLTAEEHASIWEQRNFLGSNPIMVFLGGKGADGIQAFDGQALGAGNKIIEHLNGYIGTPANSPVGYADDLLHLR